MSKFSFLRRPSAGASGPALSRPVEFFPNDVREMEKASISNPCGNPFVAGLKIEGLQVAGEAGPPNITVPLNFACGPRSLEESFCLLRSYLATQENFPEEVQKLERILKMPRLILEIGCGDGEGACQIALQNPDVGVIATDKYELTSVIGDWSHYRRTALDWREKRLAAQHFAPDNMALLRAEADILDFFPDNFLDSIFLLNPEPRVAEAFLKTIQQTSWINKVKPGPTQILVLPYSRAMGAIACGGFEFDHSEDAKGVAFLVSGPLRFRREECVHWGLNLSRLSAYSKNSTQNNLYVYGNAFRHAPESFWQSWIRKIF